MLEPVTQEAKEQLATSSVLEQMMVATNARRPNEAALVQLSTVTGHPDANAGNNASTTEGAQDIPQKKEADKQRTEHNRNCVITASPILVERTWFLFSPSLLLVH